MLEAPAQVSGVQPVGSEGAFVLVNTKRMPAGKMGIDARGQAPEYQPTGKG